MSIELSQVLQVLQHLRGWHDLVVILIKRLRRSRDKDPLFLKQCLEHLVELIAFLLGECLNEVPQFLMNTIHCIPDV